MTQTALLVASAAAATTPTTAPLSLPVAYEMAMQLESEGRDDEAVEVLRQAREAHTQELLRADVRLLTPERSH